MRRPAFTSSISLLVLTAFPVAVIAQFNQPLIGKVPPAPPLPGGVAPMPVVPPTPVTTPLNPKDDDDVTYDSGGPNQYIDKDHRWTLTGGVSLVQGDSTLQTQSAQVNMDEDAKVHDAKALAPVHLWNKDDDLTGTNGVIDFTTHLATIKDHITLIAKPSSKPQPAGSVRKQFKDPATITCDEIVYNYRRKTGHIPGPLTIHQKDRVVTADMAEYDGNRKTVDLKGHVHGTLKDGSVIDVPEAKIGIDEGHEWIFLPGKVHGVFNTKDKNGKTKGSDDDDSGPSAPAPPPALPPIPENAGSTPSPSTSTAASGADAKSTPPASTSESTTTTPPTH